MERFTDNQTWYVIFDKCHGRHWWARFLHRDFQHVHLVREINGKAVMVNNFSHVMAIREYDNTIESFLGQEAAQNPTAILQFTVHYGSHYKYGYLDLLTCVSVAKRILGIRSRLVTPKALYHELIKAGAVVLKPYQVY